MINKISSVLNSTNNTFKRVKSQCEFVNEITLYRAHSEQLLLYSQKGKLWKNYLLAASSRSC